MPNRLANSNSPYLLQHVDNPVDWYPWGEEALARARHEDKAIFLSIGYAACHWCHVMAHESFEDPEIAALMNEHFINIKVDREERPDIDRIYMDAVVAMTKQGGWPMSMFLTPGGDPFYGGTYFPPTRRYNMPSFREVLLGVAGAWQNDRANVISSGQRMSQHLQQSFLGEAEGQPLEADTSEQAAMTLAQGYDWPRGGWGQAPKFPQPMTIEFLLRRATRADTFALQMATHALDAMAKGGMYDVVGGGFARYSVDDFWLVPHFEKMLYDNAQLAAAYLYGYLLTGNEAYRRVCEETLAFVSREMTHPDGGFYSSLDADSENADGKSVEGAFYVWTPAEIRDALQDETDAQFIIAAYEITETGNFEGKNVLQQAKDDETLGKAFGMSAENARARLTRLHAALLDARAPRPRPGTDDKVLTAWNAMMLFTFAEAGRYLKRSDYTETAARNADFLLRELYPEGRLLRSWRNGHAMHNAYLDDHAMLALALLSLYQTDPNPRWFAAAEQLATDMLAHFRDPEWGFFDTRDDHEKLILRPKGLQDNALPSGNALAAQALLQLAAYTGEGKWRDPAEAALSAMQNALPRYPAAFAKWLCALDFALGPVKEVAVLQPPGTGQQFAGELWQRYRPRLVAAISAYPPAPGAPPLLANRPLRDGLPTAYVCEGFVCQQPVTTREDLAKQLG